MLQRRVAVDTWAVVVSLSKWDQGGYSLFGVCQFLLTYVVSSSGNHLFCHPQLLMDDEAVVLHLWLH